MLEPASLPYSRKGRVCCTGSCEEPGILAHGDGAWPTGTGTSRQGGSWSGSARRSSSTSRYVTRQLAEVAIPPRAVLRRIRRLGPPLPAPTRPRRRSQERKRLTT